MISNYMPSFYLDVITYPSPNPCICVNEVRESYFFSLTFCDIYICERTTSFWFWLWFSKSLYIYCSQQTEMGGTQNGLVVNKILHRTTQWIFFLWCFKIEIISTYHLQFFWHYLSQGSDLWNVHCFINLMTFQGNKIAIFAFCESELKHDHYLLYFVIQSKVKLLKVFLQNSRNTT